MSLTFALARGRQSDYELGENLDAQVLVMSDSAGKTSNDAGSGQFSKLAMPLRIGGITLPNRVFLAPMSGVTDVVFRRLAEKAGAGLVISEMVASAEFCKESAESHKRALGGDLRLHAVQLAGREACWMGEAAKRAADAGAALIDINMGCPAKKVTGGLSGSALMRDLDHAMTLIEATVNAVEVPVTLKMRLGWDDAAVNAPELAARAEGAGVQMITVHGRTRCQFYDGAADWAAVRAVKNRISIPLVVNGDIRCSESASRALEASGADAVMIGRASYGKPWLAGAMASAAAGATPDLPVSNAEQVACIIAHYESMLNLYGEDMGVRHARKHLGWYLDLFPAMVSAEMRAQVMTQRDPELVMAAIERIFLAPAPAAQSQSLAA
jgi:nifR3 family TIM-barrel protein